MRLTLLSPIYCCLALVALFIPPSTARENCIVPSNYKQSNGTASDSPAIAAAFAKCAHDATIVFPSGEEYNVFEAIVSTNLSNVNLVNSSSGTLYWFKSAGNNVHLVGTPNITTGWINSYGRAWWDANPVNGTGTAARPHLMQFNFNNGTIQHYKASKPFAWNLSVQGSNITIQDTVIDAQSTSESFPFNTDGFDVGATDVTIKNSLIFNGDDAVAVGSGAHNVLFQGATIGYQTHGMSIGSLGQNQASYANVSNVTFDDVTVINGVYGARFKSWIGGQGLAKNITWSNIRTYNVTFPVFVTQTYSNQGSSHTQVENGTTTGRPNNSSVIMQDFRWENFSGTINTFNPGDRSCVTDPFWYNVGLPDLSHTEAVIIECNTNSSCQDFYLRNIELFPQNAKSPFVICINASETLNPNLGIPCRNGTFVPLL